MDQRVFNLNESDHVITIASAGCNVLDYIIEGAMVTAVDFNSCQIALTELKKVAILNVDFEVFFEIFSMSNMQLLREVYPSKLRPHLSAPSAEFWDDGIHTIKSFMYSGTSGNMSWILFRILFPLFGLVRIIIIYLVSFLLLSHLNHFLYPLLFTYSQISNNQYHANAY